MPIKIHHGAPGAYKTSGAVQDDFIPWVLEGRTVITNVRGIESKKRVCKKIKGKKDIFVKFGLRKPVKAHKDFKLIYLDTDSSEGKAKMREWFMWAPPSAAFLIDEIQTIYPQKMTQAEYKDICYSSEEEANALDRPLDVWIAFEKHRHWNWDFVVTAPNIKKVPPIIREVAEVAYFHSNKGKIGLKGFYLEAMHNADDTGKSQSHWISHQVKRAPKKAFDLYKSTATGLVKDTEAGQNIFKQPKVIGFVVCFLGSISFLISRGNPFDAFGSPAIADEPIDIVQEPEAVKDSEIDSQTNEAPPVSNITISRGGSTNTVSLSLPPGHSDISETSARRDDFLSKYQLSIGGVLGEPFLYASDGSGSFEIGARALVGMGYSLRTLSSCLWQITGEDYDQFVMCRNDDEVQPESFIQRINPIGK